MARSLGTFVIPAIALGLLLGCGQSPDPAAQAAKPLRLQAFGDPAELVAYRELIAAFKVKAPEIQVEFIPVGRQADHMTKLTTGFAGGDPPDLFLLNFRRYGQFAAKGVLEALGPALSARGQYQETNFFEPALEAFRFDGQLVCVPQNISSLVVYWNRALFAEAGVPQPGANWDWQQFRAAAKALTRDRNGDGKIDQYGLGFEPILIRMAPFVWQAGGDIVDDLQRPTRFTLDTPEAQEAKAFLRSLYATDQSAPPLIENKAEDHETRFARGALGMILHSRRYTATLRTVQELDWDVAPLPRYKQAATVLHADAYCLAKASTQKEAAYRFVEFALSVEGASIIARSGRTVPALKSVAQSEVFLDPKAPPKSAQVFLDSIDVIRRTPNIASWNEIEMRVDPLVEEWYFSVEPPNKPLGEDLNDGARGLLMDPTP
jgi:multiple sugar transport system substrate-binding protein